jgi:hypothetical protein
MRMLLLAALALTACRSELDPGESWADPELAFAGIMAVLDSGIRPCTVRIEPDALEERVLTACRAAGLEVWPAASTESTADMELRFERVILHRPDVLRVRCTMTRPGVRLRCSYGVQRVADGWDAWGSTQSEGSDYPRFPSSDGN